MNSSYLYVQRFVDDAKLPERKSVGAAGYDICSSEDVEIQPSTWNLIPTGIGFTVPYGTYGHIAPRSGLSCKGTMVGAGIIDSDYTGEVKVLLFNMNNEKLTIKKHERIAQLIVKKIDLPQVVVVESLEQTTRGSGGFGSTGTF
jgi:dUTP pyrophosphatase